jgi:hypothetical protein
MTNSPSYPSFNEMDIRVCLLFVSMTGGAVADMAMSKALYVSFGHESYILPEQCSLAWVSMNGFVGSRFVNCCRKRARNFDSLLNLT